MDDRRCAAQDMVYQSFCPLAGQRIVEIAQNPMTGEFVIVDQDKPDNNLADVNDHESIDTTTPPSSSGTTLKENRTEWTTVPARRCHCDADARVGDTYCPTSSTH
jgi:hypothetical protein